MFESRFDYLALRPSVEPPDLSFADEFNVPQAYAVLVFDVRRASMSLPF